MPGKRKFYRRTATATANAISIKRVVKPMINRIVSSEAEKKMFDVSANNTGPIDYTGSVVSLADISQGDDINNRIGRKINLKKIWFRLSIKAPAWSSGYYGQFRVIVFQDTMNTGTDPTTADVLESVGSASSVLSPLDRAYSQSNRFHVLYDHVKHLNYSESNVELFQKILYKNLRNIDYVGSGSTVNGKNMLYMLVITDQPPTVGNPINYDVFSRVYYTDA